MADAALALESGTANWTLENLPERITISRDLARRGFDTRIARIRLEVSQEDFVERLKIPRFDVERLRRFEQNAGMPASAWIIDRIEATLNQIAKEAKNESNQKQ